MLQAQTGLNDQSDVAVDDFFIDDGKCTQGLQGIGTQFQLKNWIQSFDDRFSKTD